jgi:hypothetical protein
VFGHLPLGIWYIVEVYQKGMISGWDWLFGVLYMVVFIGVVFQVLGYGIMASPHSRYPFDRAEIVKWDRERRLMRAGVTPLPLPTDD